MLKSIIVCWYINYLLLFNPSIKNLLSHHFCFHKQPTICGLILCLFYVSFSITWPGSILDDLEMRKQTIQTFMQISFLKSIQVMSDGMTTAMCFVKDRFYKWYFWHHSEHSKLTTGALVLDLLFSTDRLNRCQPTIVLVGKTQIKEKFCFKFLNSLS